MRVTIVANDKIVLVDGVPFSVDLSGLDPTIHAVQWYDTVGEIEFVLDPIANIKTANRSINDFSPFQVFVDRWTAANAAAAVPVPLTPAQLAQKARNDALLADTLRADLLTQLQSATPAQLKTYVANNVTDLASAKTMLAKILLILSIP